MGEWSLLSVAEQLHSIGTGVLCVPVTPPVEKYMMILLKKDAGSSTPGGSWCLDIIRVSFTVNAALIVYQDSVTQSTVWGSVSVQKTGEEVSTNCAVNAIIYGLHIERHQGHQQERVVCFAMLWAAFPCISKGSSGNVL